MKRTDTTTLIKAMRVLSREIYCEDGVATAAIAEAADRIEELLITDAERDALQSLGPALKWCPDEVSVLMNILERHR